MYKEEIKKDVWEDTYNGGGCDEKHFDHDKLWVTLNKNGSKAYKDYYTKNKSQKKVFYTERGFAREYGLENVYEDQATIAEDIWINYDELMNRAKSDEVLRNKIRAIKNDYLLLSQGKMNNEFWKKNVAVMKQPPLTQWEKWDNYILRQNYFFKRDIYDLLFNP